MPEKTSRNDEIVRRYKRGDTLQSIADDFGLTKEIIRQIAVSKYGLPARGYGRVGIHLIIEGMKHVRDGLTFEQAAARIGLCANSFYQSAVRMGLHTVRPIKCDKWSERETRLVSNLYRSVSASKIAEMMGRTKNEVIGKARRLGL